MDSSCNHQFLFSLLEDKPRLTSRRIHIRRLYDILHLSLQQQDMARARRAWAILARCNEVNWKNLWTLSVGLLDCHVNDVESTPTKVDYLKAMMLQHPDEREKILTELIHFYILADRHRDALDELEFCLPSFPYHDNPTLHLYAGLCSMFNAQLSNDMIEGKSFVMMHAASPECLAGNDDSGGTDRNLIDRAQIFFQRAKALDPNNTVVDLLVNMAQCLLQAPRTDLRHESDEDMPESPEASRTKRLRVEHGTF
ncbi:hypothetical protein F5J12DRAFT_10787 [Pisolithus orientalis]|uniref:uncharacterized protein n=1 Tax=Pisolithus orientalis TaxID=936130 RepID=UPI002225A50B|nr:uncharacterized protein F5J12DRAFT_10787 [Pisolithus orientalis]KAI6035075.1 hypothetical protein F5J12DRAFT_10787 [Pisolithus orientalis]